LETRFSVIIPAFNREAVLGRAIKSVIHQTLPAFEIIIVDDGSTDNTQALVKEFPKVTYVNQPNNGVSSARNKGAELATGEWLVFLDSDDELLPNALEDFSKEISMHINPCVVRAGFILVKGNQKTNFLFSQKKSIGPIPGSFTILKDFFFEIGKYNDQLKFAENTELFFRINWKGVIPHLLQGTVLQYHQDPSGGNSNLINMTNSLHIILDKHEGKLTGRLKRLYNQILGVNYLRFRDFRKARKHFFKAFLYQPYKLDTLARWGIALFPALAKFLYAPYTVK
jgi:glycosyltransferase involved in cell wall biosynthesis